MSGSVNTELSYERSLRQPSQGATPSSPDERAPPRVAEQPPDISSPHAPDSASDPQAVNRFSVVSAVSLEPSRRRSRHHHSRHSHIHSDLAHMLSVSSRDTKELRRGLNTAFEKLDQSRQRASHAEKLALEMVLRVNQAEEERSNAMRHASTVREELGKYKALLDNAHGEIRRAQQMLEDQEQLRYEAETSAARARDNARQMKQKRLIELAREQGRKMGYNEGIQTGQRIGYHESQSPLDDGRFYPNDEPRFREIFESQYRLEEFDQPPPFRDVYLNPSSPLDAEVPLPTPLPIRQVYPRLQTQFGEPLRQSNGASNQPPEPPYTPVSPSRGVPRAASTDSSSTTTLPAAPIPQPVSSRAPPPMPTIPEVESTDVGSTPRRSRSLRDSLSTQNQTPQASNFTSVLPPVIPFSQGSAAFEPPPGTFEDPTSGRINGYPPESGGPIYEAPSPRRAFDDHSILTNGTIPDVSQSPVRENFSSTIGAIQNPAQEYFEIIPGDIPSPAREHFTTTHSPRAARTHFDGVRPVDGRQNPEFSGRPSSRSGALPRHDGPPKQYPIPQMPAPLAPQPSINTPYAHASHNTGPRRRPSESDNWMQRDTRLPVNAVPDVAANRHQPPPQVMPISVERRTDMMPEQRTHPMPARTSSGQRLDINADHGPRRTTTPPFFPGDYPVDRPVESQNHRRSADHGPRRTTTPPFFPSDYPVDRPVESQNYRRSAAYDQPHTTAPLFPGDYLADQLAEPQNHRRSAAYDQPNTTAPPLFPGDYPADQLVEPQNHRRSATYDLPQATAPPFFNGNPSTVQPMEHRNHRRSAAQDPQPTTAPFFAGGRPASQSIDPQNYRPSSTRNQRPTTDPSYSTGDPTTSRPMEPENHRPRVQVQIPPSRSFPPNPASPRTATLLATQQSHVPPADMYSPYATSSNPNISASDIANQSPRRYPPTLYNEPNLQRQPTPGVDHGQEGGGSPPGLLVPSRDTRTTSPSTVLPRTGSLNGNSYAVGQRTAITSPHNDTPTETLPIRPPSVSPRPSPAGFAQQISPAHGSMTSPTLRRAASPNPLPRGASPAPLPRASSPAPLPIRSPSVRSARIHRNASDVSLPGGRGSPYMHYNPELEADIAMLASSSADRLREAKR